MNEQILNIITRVFEVCVIPLLGVLTMRLIGYINQKKMEAQAKLDNELFKNALDSLEKLVVDCVLATKQTYVDELKKMDLFDLDAHERAFQMTKSAVLKVLDTDTRALLEATLGDLNVYLQQLIEAKVSCNK